MRSSAASASCLAAPPLHFILLLSAEGVASCQLFCAGLCLAPPRPIIPLPLLSSIPLHILEPRCTFTQQPVAVQTSSPQTPIPQTQHPLSSPFVILSCSRACNPRGPAWAHFRGPGWLGAAALTQSVRNAKKDDKSIQIKRFSTANRIQLPFLSFDAAACMK